MKFIIFKEKAGVLADTPLWVIFHHTHMYSHKTLFGVLWLFLSQYKHDKHLIG